MNVTPTDYLGALIPLPVRVLGTKLKPFSLGHRLILERFDSPFVIGGPVEIGDLLIAIVVCSRTTEDALVALDSIKAARQARNLGWRVRLSGADLLSTIAAFRQYIEDGSKMPTFWQRTDGGQRKRLAVPLTVLVKVYLQRHLNYDEQSVMNKPWGAALHEYCVGLSMDGTLDLVDSEEAEFIKNLKPLTEEEKALFRKGANGV